MPGEVSKSVGQWIVDNLGWLSIVLLFLFSLFFEFSKIKLNPISAFCRRVGQGLTSGLKTYIEELKADTNKQIKELEATTTKNLNEIKTNATSNCQKMQEKLTEVENKITDVEERQDKQAASRIKSHVFNFAKECYAGVMHTKGDFENLINENKEYEKLVKKHGWTNDVYTEEFEYIMRVYRHCQDKNSFQPTDI